MDNHMDVQRFRLMLELIVVNLRIVALLSNLIQQK